MNRGKMMALVVGLVQGMIFTEVGAQSTQMSTYCNPLNLDYTYMIYNAHNNISYRSGADPAVVRFRNEYYMFVTRSIGYRHSTDLHHWSFITPEKWYFQGSNAPAAFNYTDSVLYVAGDPSGSMSVLYTGYPKKGDWKATPANLWDLQDPALFIDNNKRYRNIHVPTPHLAISDLRVFGLGNGKAPATVRNFTVNRCADRRNAPIRWDRRPGTQGYNVLWGIAPGKLYSSWMVYDDNQLLLKSLTTNQTYYFAIEAFNENGVSSRSGVKKVN